MKYRDVKIKNFEHYRHLLPIDYCTFVPTYRYNLGILWVAIHDVRLIFTFTTPTY